MKDRTAYYNEWHIGLFKNLTGNWSWVNGKPLTLNKWQPHEPDKDDIYSLMAKEFPTGSYGLFGGIGDRVYRGWICEEETGLNICYISCIYYNTVQYVAQLSYGSSFRTKRTLFDYFRRSFKSSSTEESQK